MVIFHSIAMAFSMFSKLPMPQIEWNKKNMRYMLCAFPLIGVVIGLFLRGWLWLCDWLNFGTLLFSAGITLIPVAITGGIHLDGLCDTVDALSSHSAPDKKRAILKDPHTGAFAVIGVCAYLLLYFSLSAELIRSSDTIFLLGVAHALSRALTGLASLLFPKNSSDGLLHTFSVSADKRTAVAILFILLILCAGGFILLTGYESVFILLPSLCGGVYLFCMSKRQFGGMSGDLSGFLLQLSEIIMLAGIVITQKVVLI